MRTMTAVCLFFCVLCFFYALFCVYLFCTTGDTEAGIGIFCGLSAAVSAASAAIATTL